MQRKNTRAFNGTTENNLQFKVQEMSWNCFAVLLNIVKYVCIKNDLYNSECISHALSCKYF